MFDDLDPVETNYIGLAQVPLLPLAQGHPIQGSVLPSHHSGFNQHQLWLCVFWEALLERKSVFVYVLAKKVVT